jgi:DNA ligase D-like protein (predicted polymerase)
LRTDKPAKAIRRETAQTPPNAVPAGTTAAGSLSSIKVTHGERVIDATTGLTKLQLVRYYESIADRILPHLKGRPCSLVRGPNGVAGQLFFQKHGEKIGIPGIKELDPALWPGHAALIEVDNATALAGAAQLNVIEFHTWNSTKKAIDRPDRMIFDLDPGEGTSWAHVQEAAVLTRTLLSELGLQSWLKTSGGKGLHVVVPLAPRADYETVNGFSKAIVQHLARTIPSRFVGELPKEHVEAETTMSGGESLWRAQWSEHADPFAHVGRGAGRGPGWQRATAAGGMSQTPGRVVEARASAVSFAQPGRKDIALGMRVFHTKFGYGAVVEIEGNKLEIDFEHAGRKRVLDSFVSLP